MVMLLMLLMMTMGIMKERQRKHKWSNLKISQSKCTGNRFKFYKLRSLRLARAKYLYSDCRILINKITISMHLLVNGFLSFFLSVKQSHWRQMVWICKRDKERSSTAKSNSIGGRSSVATVVSVASWIEYNHYQTHIH